MSTAALLEALYIIARKTVALVAVFAIHIAILTKNWKW
tara:strand:- start:740 stop:853 length:114 start_codon:yes stop_codon:yes gene_type:complete